MRHGQGPHMCGPSGRRMRRPAQNDDGARSYSAASSHQ